MLDVLLSCECDEYYKFYDRSNKLMCTEYISRKRQKKKKTFSYSICANEDDEEWVGSKGWGKRIYWNKSDTWRRESRWWYRGKV